MRYHLESTLPINAFQPVGGKYSPFKQRMTLEGGGGGVISSVTNSISDALGTSGSGGGILGGLAEFDKGVSNVIPVDGELLELRLQHILADLLERQPPKE